MIFSSSLNLTIANIGLKLTLESKAASATAAQFEGFIGGTPTYHFQVQCSDQLYRQTNKTPQVNITSKELRISAPMSFEVVLNRRTRNGLIRYSTHRMDTRGTRPPVCLYAALKSLYAVLLCERTGLLLHASAVALDGGAITFIGPSGAGKSTLCKTFTDDNILNDELVAVTLEDGYALVHATPFSYSFDTPRKRRHVPLKTAFILQKSQTAYTFPLSPSEAFPLILQCVPIPQGDPQIEVDAFKTASHLTTMVDCRRLAAAPDSRATIHVLHTILKDM